MLSSATSLYGSHPPARRLACPVGMLRRGGAFFLLAVVVGCADRTTAPSDGGPAVVAATIDGKGWRADPGAAAGRFNAITGSSGFTVFALRCGSCPSLLQSQEAPPGSDTVETLVFQIDPFTGPGTYRSPLPERLARQRSWRRSLLSSSPRALILRPRCRMCFAPSPAAGSSSPRSIRLGVRAVGRFDFDAADSTGALRRVRDGVFDVPLSDQPPPVSVRLQLPATNGP